MRVGDSACLPPATPSPARVESCVGLTYNSKEEAGRHAVARCHLSPGELVLTAAPFAIVMNPNYCPSALYLSSKATTKPDVALAESSAQPGGKVVKKLKPTAAKKTGAHGGGNRARGAATASAAGGSASASHYTHALEDETGVQGEVSSTNTSRWYTTTPTWCSVCFREIPAGWRLCNRGSLAELAMDISEEQEELDRSIRAAETLTNGSDCADKGNEGDRDSVSEDNAVSATAAAAFRKLKKPSKSSETRKDGTVELKQRLLEKALALREELLLRRRLQRRHRAEQGLPVVRREGWEASTSSSSDAAGAEYGKAAVSGCAGCGVLCYCSETCWRAHREEHEESGECTLLRLLYPRLMAVYYTMGAASPSASAGGAPSTVVMPGDEPLYWARSTSEPRMLEFQSLLFSAIVVARACRAGYRTHCAAAVEDAAVSLGGAVTSKVATASSADHGSDFVESVPEAGTLDAQLLPPTNDSTLSGQAEQRRSETPLASPTLTVVDSVVIPKEVWSIDEMRAKAGLTGTVEVLDADPELRRIARKVSELREPSAEGQPDGTNNSSSADPCVAPMRNAELMRGYSSINTGRDVAGEERLWQLCTGTPQYADVAQLETNLSVLSKHHRSTYQRYYRVFAKRVLPVLQQLLLPHEKQGATVGGRDGDRDADAASRPLTHHEEGTAEVLQVSEAYFQRLCAAAQCNSFGIYDTQGHCISFGLYPAASYFNHSCLPNLCRVMHHGGRTAAFYALRAIAPREPLTICYTDVEQLNSAERRRNLLGTYRFFCTCERCSGKAEGPQMAVAVAGIRKNVCSSCLGCVEVSLAAFENPLLLCAECSVHGYLRPLPPPLFGSLPVKSDACVTSTQSWTMQEVQVRQCTVCQSRVVRETAAAAATLQ